MKIHSDVITYQDIWNAEKIASVGGHGKVYLEFVSQGSRSRKNAFEVHLEGDGSVSKRKPNDRGNSDRQYAATWSQWGWFLAALYEIDPEMKCAYYADLEDYNIKTDNAFADVTKIDPRTKNPNWRFRRNYWTEFHAERVSNA